MACEKIMIKKQQTNSKNRNNNNNNNNATELSCETRVSLHYLCAGDNVGLSTHLHLRS